MMASPSGSEKRRDDHVIVHNGAGKHPAGTVECLGCGDTMMLPTPLRLDMFAPLCKAYMRQHGASCRQRAAAPERLARPPKNQSEDAHA